MNYAAIAGQGLGILLALMTVLFIFRIILTWYPQVELTKMPWRLIAWPTEPLLVPLRRLIPPIGGSGSRADFMGLYLHVFTGNFNWSAGINHHGVSLAIGSKGTLIRDYASKSNESLGLKRRGDRVLYWLNEWHFC